MSIRVHYFDAYGRAEAIRMILTHAKVAFEDVRHAREDFPKLKDSLEFGQVPAIEIDGKFYV